MNEKFLVVLITPQGHGHERVESFAGEGADRKPELGDCEVEYEFVIFEEVDNGHEIFDGKFMQRISLSIVYKFIKDFLFEDDGDENIFGSGYELHLDLLSAHD